MPSVIIKPDKEGFQNLMEGSDMKSYLRELATEMTDGDARYDIQTWRARRSRLVVNIRDLSPDAISHEITTGKLAAMSVRRVG